MDTIHNRSGRKPKLTCEQLKALSEMLDYGAEYWGYGGQVWTQARVAELIKRKFDVTYALNYVGVLLHACGFSVQRPLRKAIQRHEEGIQQWVKKDWPAVKKTLEEGREVVFVDESGFYLLPHVVRT